VLRRRPRHRHDHPAAELSLRARLLRTRRKRRAELAFWAGRAAAEGELANYWYEAAFTSVFGIERAWYAGKRLLDVGCGPRGSLEWAADAAARVGADPLARRYARLNGGRHAMRYVTARAEALPFPDASFDVVSAFNALDHVESVERAARELVRVLAPGGTLLLLVETGRPPTVTEPHALGPETLALFGLPVVSSRVVGAPHGALYWDLEEDAPWSPGQPGWLVARLSRPL
jgi:SAM-dependent methyltransferase